jgi:4-hydroxy-tetrahydrodipicolinate synthase
MRVFEDIRTTEMNGANVTGVKSALAAIGNDCGPTRPPSAWPLPTAQLEKMNEFLRNNGLLDG